MSVPRLENLRLPESDLDFLVETIAPEVVDKQRLKQVINEDKDFRNASVGDESVFRRVMDGGGEFVGISPALFFEVLLRRAVFELKQADYTLEKTPQGKTPVFDGRDLVSLLREESLILYLADMLSSFLKIECFTLSFRTKTGARRDIRFSELDIHALESLAETVASKHKLGFYKRIADICLFVSGIFPDHAVRQNRYPCSGDVRVQTHPNQPRISPQEYEETGRGFYKLAAEHRAAQEMGLSNVFWSLHGKFELAKKPLGLVADNCLQYGMPLFLGCP